MHLFAFKASANERALLRLGEFRIKSRPSQTWQARTLWLIDNRFGWLTQKMVLNYEYVTRNSYIVANGQNFLVLYSKNRRFWWKRPRRWDRSSALHFMQPYIDSNRLKKTEKRFRFFLKVHKTKANTANKSLLLRYVQFSLHEFRLEIV